MARVTLASLFVCALGCASAPASTPTPVAVAESKPLEDLGGRVFRAEAEGFKVLVHWARGEIELRGCHPQLGCGPHYCREPFTDFPAHVTCDNGGTIDLSPTANGYRMTVGGAFLEYFQFVDPNARTLIPVRPGPTTFDMVRVSPLVTAFTDEAFARSQSTPNSSPETNALGTLMGERPPKPLPDVEAIAAIVRERGVDPETLPLETAEEIRGEIETRSSNAGLSLQLGVLRDDIAEVIDDAGADR